MILSQCEFRPGKVVKVVDNYGTVKASFVGGFADDEDVEKMPEVYPFIRTSTNGFCKPTEGDDVWVLYNRDNPQALYYLFRGDIRNANGDFLGNSFRDVEVISKHGNDETGTNLMMTSEDGWVMQNGKSRVQVDNDGLVRLTADDEKRQVNVGPDNISLVSGGDAQPAVLGNKLVECLNKLVQALNQTASVAMSNPYTTAVGTALNGALATFTSSINEILSKNVVLD